jgi:glycosyltransferase involved in cell wall biosynthesis
MKKILFIHQSSELYGSDKTLLSFLSSYNKSLLIPIVILPVEGLLKTEIEKLNIECHVIPVMKLHRKMFTFFNLFNFLNMYFYSIKKLKNLHSINNFDTVYSNTISVLIGFFFSKINKIHHIWHVHEIIDNSIIIKKIFTYFLSNKSNNLLIFNSRSTQEFWNITTIKNEVIWNGVYPPEESNRAETERVRKDFFHTSDAICIVLVGRINRWKGQNLLLNAFEKLKKIHEKILLIYIGSAPQGQEYLESELKKNIEKKGLKNFVRHIPFQSDIYPFQKALDIIVVPSTEPEPFGLVAIEGMFAKKPVVAANHGGLKEIVVDSETGFTFSPGSENELFFCLEKLILSSTLRIKFGENGFKRANQLFSLDTYVKNIENAVLNS